MGRYQREKGKRGEREAKKFLASFGYNFERPAQFSGKARDSADLRPVRSEEGTPLEYDHLRCEIKYGYPGVEIHHKEFREWVFQIHEEARRHGQTGFVLWRKPRRPWLIAYIGFSTNAIMISNDVELCLGTLVSV